MKTLFITEVGSRMWGMEEFASDYDLIEIYQEDTKDILRGKRLTATLPQCSYYDEQNRLIDKQYMEIGHLINLLCKGNINAIWAVTSPIVHREDKWQFVLDSIVRDNLSTASYNSIYGMAISQERDSTKRADVRDARKSRLTALRTLRFGVELLQCRNLNFNIMQKYEPKEDVDHNELIYERLKLSLALKGSSLPDMVNPTPFRDLLYDIRIEGLL